MPRVDLVDLSGWVLGINQAKALASRLSDVRSLETLDLAGCGIHVDQFFEKLPAYPRLKKLNLSKNQLGPLEMIRLAKVIPQMPRLRELILSGNQIGKEWVEALLEAKKPPRLKVLGLDSAGNTDKVRSSLLH